MRYLDRIIQERQTAVDVGANEGLFSYVMSKQFSKVYSFEINDGISKELSAYNPGNIEIINKGLSSQTGTAYSLCSSIERNTPDWMGKPYPQ